MSQMFCFQCEQTSGMKGCSTLGVCGKDSDTSALQDLLLYACRGISAFAFRSQKLGSLNAEINHFILRALFTTVTNVNFDPERMKDMLFEAEKILSLARQEYLTATRAKNSPLESLNGATCWIPSSNLKDMINEGIKVGLVQRLQKLDPDVASLQEILTYGLKGMSAYAQHALVLGHEDEEVYAFIHEALASLEMNLGDPSQLLKLCMRCGEINLKVMAMLDLAHREKYGSPTPTQVRIEPIKGKCILVSGHDLRDLEELLKQTENKGINIYTHGEMLPAHGYPNLKKYKHLVGNYGGAWQDQREEFKSFPGSILMTTNCIQKPDPSYIQRIFTSGVVAWPEVQHITNHDFSPVIASALESSGFQEDGSNKTILVGFAHEAILSHAETVVSAVKAGALKHFFLIGGCDGAKSGRNYYTDFAEIVPNDCAILTLGCGKYRFNKLPLGDIGGIPRLLDCGQCNDAYSAIQVAVALSKAFGCTVNELPLSMIISWFEQKAVAVLLSLLFLGIKDIRLGPTLPAFISPGIAQVLSKEFGLKGITTAQNDLAECLA